MTALPVFSFFPKTPSQRRAVQAFNSSDLSFFLGPAGTGKSFCAIACALNEVLSGTSKKKQVIYVRPMLESGQSVGYLPGTLDEKYEPYLDAVGPILQKMVYKLPPDTIVYKPLTFLRSQTFDDCVAILDESQNSDRRQHKLFLTRMGQNCKMIICGDPEQQDIRPTQDEWYSDLDWTVERLKDVPGVSEVEFDPAHVLRHRLVSEFTKRL